MTEEDAEKLNKFLVNNQNLQASRLVATADGKHYEFRLLSRATASTETDSERTVESFLYDYFLIKLPREVE